MLYFISSEHHPFSENNAKLILTTEPYYPKTFSIELTDLLNQLLKKEPEQRILLSEIKNHPWLSDCKYNHLIGSLLNYHPCSRVNIGQKIVEQVQFLEINCSNRKQNLSIENLDNDTIAYRMLFKEKITKRFQFLNPCKGLTQYEWK
jgi:serine/threonine protein kinase